MNQNALELRGLTKTFPGFMLDGITLTLPAGCVMGLVGENGAGKSTTIRLILDILHKDAGSVQLFGTDNTAGIRALKEDIGVVLDDVGIPDCLNAKQVGKIMKNIYARWDRAVYEDLLERLGVPRNKVFKDFSRGNKMKLGIAVALSHHPKLLLFDEATSGLDPVVRDDVTDLITEFTRDEEHAVLLSSHIVSDLEKVCDYVAFLHEGRLLLCEEKDRLAEEYGILRASAEEANTLPEDAVVRRRESAWGVEALVLREKIPTGLNVSPVGIEELFVFLVKEERA